MATHGHIDDQDIETFDKDGVILLRGVFKDWVDPLRAGIDQLMQDPSPRERSVQPADGSARFFQDLCNWRRIKPFEDFVRNSPAAEIAARLMQSQTGRFFHDHVLVKEPGTSVVTPWHQDMPYYCVGGEKTVSIWMPLDSIPRETALQCIAGSHKWGKMHKPMRFDGTELYEGDDSEELPDIEADRDAYDIRHWAMEPGDAVAFDFRTVHGAQANTGPGSRRRAFSARWVGDGAVFVDRAGKGSPPFDHLTLQTGDPLQGDEFPVVYRQNA